MSTRSPGDSGYLHVQKAEASSLAKSPSERLHILQTGAMSSFANPILPGFYPDPSCIRVGDAFYMASSSFHVFPGIPIHKSKDLINWELIGNAINRPSQISLNRATTKINNPSRREVFTGGIYAPTIRYHEGVYYIVCTNLTGAPDMPSNADFHPSNFIITATDLRIRVPTASPPTSTSTG